MVEKLDYGKKCLNAILINIRECKSENLYIVVKKCMIDCYFLKDLIL